MSNVDDIIAAFEREGSEFSLRAAEDISAKSPTALKVTRALLLRAAGAPDVETCLDERIQGGVPHAGDPRSL